MVLKIEVATRLQNKWYFVLCNKCNAALKHFMCSAAHMIRLNATVNEAVKCSSFGKFPVATETECRALQFLSPKNDLVS